MELLSDKITGGTLTAVEWNQVPKELENVITGTGQALTNADLNLLGKAIAGYVANGFFYTDTGTAGAYILNIIGSKQRAPSLTDGFKVEFITTNPNPGAATVNVASLGVINIKTQDGIDPLAGDISGFVILNFDSASGNFTLINPSVTGVAREFEIVQQMKDSLVLVPGMFARTFGYLTKDDGGGNDYFIVGPATGTDDGGTFITLASGDKAQGLFRSGVVNPQQYGATFDNVTDDFVSLRAANINPVSRHVEYPGKTAFSSDTVPFDSAYDYRGVPGVTRVRMTANKRIMTSRAFISSESVSPTGNMSLYGFDFEGSLTNLAQIGVTIHDSGCNLQAVRVINCGNGGVSLTHLNDISAVIGTALPNNRLYDIDIIDCGGIGINLGDIDNDKVIDGFLSNVTIKMKNGGSPIKHFQCGSAQGWDISSLRTEGDTPLLAAELGNARDTRFTNIHIEDFEDCGIDCRKIQGDVKIIAQINADSAINGSDALRISDNLTITELPSVDISLSVTLESAIAGISCLRNDFAAQNSEIYADIRRGGSELALLKVVDALTSAQEDQVRIMRNAVVKADFLDQGNRSNADGLSHDSKRLAYSFYSSILIGTSAQTVTVPIRLVNVDKLIGTINIEANTSDTPPTLSVYQGRFFMSADGANPWSGNLITTITPTGFTVAPSITVTKGVGDDGTLDVNFTFNNANAKGVCSVTF